jgi:hypothetical protein
MAAVQRVAMMDDAELMRRARHTWEYVRKHHTRKAFTRAFESFIDDLEPRYTEKT